MRTAALWLASAALASAAISPQSALADEPGEKTEKKGEAAALGGLAAIGIGIATTTTKHGEAHRHDSQWDGKLYGAPFSPAAGVVCIPGQRQCYEGGHFSYGWTKRVFAASAAFADAGGAGEDGDFGDFGTFGVDLERARTVCLERSASVRLKNVSIDEAKQMTDEWAYVYMRARPNPKLPDYQRWRCAYSFQSGKTDFKRM